MQRRIDPSATDAPCSWRQIPAVIGAGVLTASAVNEMRSTITKEERIHHSILPIADGCRTPIEDRAWGSDPSRDWRGLQADLKWTTFGPDQYFACVRNPPQISVGFMCDNELEAGMAGRHMPRTVLEELLRQQDQTYEEIARDFETVAQQLGEHGVSISSRHLRRLASGERTGTTPATRRVLQAMFNRKMDELLQPWPGGEPAEDESRASRRSSGAARLEILAAAAQRAHGFALLTQTSVTGELMEQLYDDVSQLARMYSSPAAPGNPRPSGHDARHPVQASKGVADAGLRASALFPGCGDKQSAGEGKSRSW